jgi:hypothetical protein
MLLLLAIRFRRAALVLPRPLLVVFPAVLALLAMNAAAQTLPPSFEILTHRMDVDVDGAPNAYGPRGKPALDTLDHAYDEFHRRIVGYLLDEHHHPVVQGPGDPFPGYYVSQTTFMDPANDNDRDPRAYLDATKINYVVLGKEARKRGAVVGDFAAVYSRRTHRSVFAVVGDDGNPSGDEGSLHLLQALGYPFHDGVNDAVEGPEIVIRFYPHSNARQQFFHAQAALDEAAKRFGVSREFKEQRVRE